VVDSAIARACDGALYTHAGPEIGVASTKCFTAQLAALSLLAIHLGRRTGGLGDAAAAELIRELLLVPQKMSETLAALGDMKELAERYKDAKDFLYLGRGTNYPIALEGALKLKEISYIHAEGYAAGEMKHGPIALIDDGIPVVVIAPRGKGYEKVLSNLAEVRAREGHIIAWRRRVTRRSPVSAGRALGAGRAAAAAADADRDPAAAPGVRGGPGEGERRRPTSQPRQERDGRMIPLSRPSAGGGGPGWGSRALSGSPFDPSPR
jgi:hypothetical protein